MYLAGLHSAKPVRERGYANDLIAPVKEIVEGGKTSWIFSDKVTITHATLWRGERCLAIFPAPYEGWLVEAGNDIGLHLERLDFATRVQGEPFDFSDEGVITERIA